MTGLAWPPAQAPASLRAGALAEVGAEVLRGPHADLIQRCQRELSTLVPEASRAGVDPALVILGALSVLASEITEADRVSRESELRLAAQATAEAIRARVLKAIG